MALALEELGLEVTEGAGGTVWFGLFRNGPGPVIMLRTVYGCPASEGDNGAHHGPALSPPLTSRGWRHQ